MFEWMPFWPATAAESGQVVNALFIAELVLSVVIVLTVAVLMLNFVVRYHHGSSASRAHRVHATWRYEIGWTSATLVAFLVLFVFGAHYYIWLYKSPAADIEIFVVGKQWMWKVQHPGGQREIDEVHVPVGKIVRLVIASQDVVHSFFVPAFRIKRDAVPGTYNSVWFKATVPGTYRLECSEFCGTEHVKMAGAIVAMEPAAYTDWLAERGTGETLAQQGARLFRELGCSGCHSAASTVHAPSLVGLYGRLVHLMDGTTVVADRQYVMDSILLPKKQIVAGYPPVMPSFAGQIGEEDLIKLIAYIESLSPGTR
jgi:cytochrome c oxidase subunit II